MDPCSLDERVSFDPLFIQYYGGLHVILAVSF